MSIPKEVFVKDAPALDACCSQLAHAKCFGLDTEFVGEESYHPQLCLIQVATPDSLYLIDPFAFDNLDGFWQTVVDPAHEVVVHAGREEVRICHLNCGKTPRNLFDLQIAAGLVGLSYPLGHGPLVNQVLGKQLTKAETLTEWRTRPLTAAQLRYAFDDVRYLLAIWQDLSAQLDQLGRRSWLREECERLREVATPDQAGTFLANEKWRKIRGASALDRRRLGVLRAVFEWREQEAVRTNRPPRTLIRDDLLVEVARHNVKSAKDLEVVRGLARRYTDSLMSAITDARDLATEQLPVLSEREFDTPQVGLLVNFLSIVLAHWCHQEQIAPNLVAGVQDLKGLVRSRLQDIELKDVSLNRGWRLERVLPILEDALAGRSSVRIGAFQGDMPFAVEKVGEK